MSELQSFYNMSGLKINQSKTQLVWIGSKKYSNHKLCQEIELIWTINFKLSWYSILCRSFKDH